MAKKRTLLEAASSQAGSPLKCSNTDEICQFPFILNNITHWDCVSQGDGPVCNVRGEETIQTFTNTSTFLPCQDCQNQCGRTGVSYVGLNLATPEAFQSRMMAMREVSRTAVDCQNASTNGTDYRGQTHVTKDGLTCQAWADIPANHQHHAVADSNYCRLASEYSYTTSGTLTRHEVKLRSGATLMPMPLIGATALYPSVQVFWLVDIMPII